MTEREKERKKLIELLEEADQVAQAKGIIDYKDAIADNADHLLSNGAIVPPCKVGSVVYKVVNDKRVKKPYECKVVGFWYSEDERCNNAHLVRYVSGVFGDVFDCSFSVPFTDFGKTVFLTKDEAEKALMRYKNEGNC